MAVAAMRRVALYGQVVVVDRGEKLVGVRLFRGWPGALRNGVRRQIVAGRTPRAASEPHRKWEGGFKNPHLATPHDREARVPVRTS